MEWITWLFVYEGALPRISWVCLAIFMFCFTIVMARLDDKYYESNP
jgi:hypothetical protein